MNKEGKGKGRWSAKGEDEDNRWVISVGDSWGANRADAMRGSHQTIALPQTQTPPLRLGTRAAEVPTIRCRRLPARRGLISGLSVTDRYSRLSSPAHPQVT